MGTQTPGVSQAREGREVYGRIRTYEKIAARGPKHQLSILKGKPREMRGDLFGSLPQAA